MAEGYVLSPSMLNQTCTIKRYTEAKSATTAAYTSAASDLATTVRCAIQADSSREAREYQRETGNRLYRGYFAYGQDIRSDDLVVPNGGSASGLILTVKGPPIDHGGRNTYAMVPLEHTVGVPG